MKPIRRRTAYGSLSPLLVMFSLGQKKGHDGTTLLWDNDLLHKNNIMILIGLNVTVWLLSLMDEHLLDVFFYNNPLPVLETFNVIYSFVFLEFSRFWHISRPSNIMQFGDVSRQFRSKITTTLSGSSNF